MGSFAIDIENQKKMFIWKFWRRFYGPLPKFEFWRPSNKQNQLIVIWIWKNIHEEMTKVIIKISRKWLYKVELSIEKFMILWVYIEFLGIKTQQNDKFLPEEKSFSIPKKINEKWKNLQTN